MFIIQSAAVAGNARQQYQRTILHCAFCVEPGHSQSACTSHQHTACRCHVMCWDEPGLGIFVEGAAVTGNGR